MPDKFLKTLRVAKGWSQGELGQRAGCSQRTISRLESDPYADPSYRTQIGIAAALGVDPDDLAFGPPPKRRAK